jgi:hypothetical protein
MDAEFSRELIERQQFALERQIDNGSSCALQDRQRNWPSSAVPSAQRFDRRAEQRSKHLLIQTDGTSKVTKLGGHAYTMPLALLVVQRRPAYMAGDRFISVSYLRRAAICKSIKMLRETDGAECGPHSQDRSLFSMCSSFDRTNISQRTHVLHVRERQYTFEDQAGH